MNLYLEFIVMWIATVIAVCITAVAAIILVAIGEALSEKFGGSK